MNNLPAHNPKYADFDQSAIDLTIDHPELGTIPFTASANDSEALGQSLYARAKSGEFGDIAPYDGPPPPDPQEVLAQEVRTARNQKLAALDAVVMNPLRWAEFDDVQKAALAAYRQALLDVPQQAGFPNDINWPEAPGFLSNAPPLAP